MSLDAFQEKIKSITKELDCLNFSHESFLDDVNQKLPVTDPFIQEFVELAKKGLQDGWLCDKENGDLKFSRVCKPTEEFHQFSCDSVWMPNCQGPKHTHPNGELSFCIAMEGDPKFDGFGPGWALYNPGTTHIPTVTGGTMLILYFLPEGAVEWS